MKPKYLRIGLPVGLGAVIIGVLLGVFLPGGGDTSSAPSGAETGSAKEGAAQGGRDAAATDGSPGTDSATQSAAGREVSGADDAEGQAAAANQKGGETAGIAGALDGSETDAASSSGGSRRADTAIASVEGGSAGNADGGPSQADQPAVGAASSSADRAAAGEAPARATPSFDVVRINPRGGTVMAGRAEPGAQVIIRDGEQEIGRVTANPRGEWVFTDDRPLPSGDRQLSLEDAGPGGLESESVVVVSVPDHTPSGLEGAAEGEQALAVLQPREGGPSVILQLPEGAAAQAETPHAAVDSVDYTSEGEITVSGRSAPGARLNVYVDNEPVATAQADEQGRWRAELGAGVSEGQHRLRIDSVDQDGKVMARAETAIARASKTMLELAGETLVIVQPGNSLWRIARRTYGGGIHYTEIYQANADQIRDPNLIYPGQIFTVPPLG